MREKNELLDETTWRIIREAKGIAGWVAVSAVLGILAVLCSIAAPEILGNLIQKLYDFGLSDRQTPIRDSLVSGLLLLTAVYAAQGVFRYLKMQLMNRTVSRHFTCDLRIAISDKIRRLPVKYVDQTPVGDVLNRMIDDVSAMGNYIHQVFDVMVEGVFQITMIAVASTSSSPKRVQKMAPTATSSMAVVALPFNRTLSSLMTALRSRR